MVQDANTVTMEELVHTLMVLFPMTMSDPN